MGLLDDSGLERATRFIEEQRRYLSSCRQQFEKAKKTMADTERRLDEEKRGLKGKREKAEGEVRALEKAGSGK